jgi:DNA processing protein
MTYEKVGNWVEYEGLKRLGDLKPAPEAIYIQGTWGEGLFENCVAVVGSRRMSEYGRRVLEKLIPQLVLQRKTIVSGFMYGVDQYAHTLALDNGGKTVAVLGWGITYESPDERDQKLVKRILAEGSVLVSEWEEQKPMLWTFPKRNRIVAALTKEVFVIEAALKSGSLITADLATQLHRTLWAVPGPITSRMSEGTNRLIADGLAHSWLGAQAVRRTKCEVRSKTTNGQDGLLSMLEGEGLGANDLARRMGKPVHEVGAQLSMLTLTGEVFERNGKFYVE